jgi:hypothetical protein
LYVKIFFNRDSTIQSTFRRLCTGCKSEDFRFPASRLNDVSSRPDAHLSILPDVRTTCHTVRTPDKLKHHLFGRRGFPSGRFSVSRSFCSSLHPSGRLSVFDQASDSFQVQIWEDCCNRPDDVDSRHRNSNSPVWTSVSMVQTRVQQIWKLRIQLQPSGHLPLMVRTRAY